MTIKTKTKKQTSKLTPHCTLCVVHPSGAAQMILCNTSGSNHRCQPTRTTVSTRLSTYFFALAYLLLQTLGTTQTRSFPPPSSARAPPTAPPPLPSLLRTALRSFIACALLPFSLLGRVRPENTKRVDFRYHGTRFFGGVEDVYAGNTCAYLSSPSNIINLRGRIFVAARYRSRAMVLYACVAFSNFHEEF